MINRVTVVVQLPVWLRILGTWLVLLHLVQYSARIGPWSTPERLCIMNGFLTPLETTRKHLKTRIFKSFVDNSIIESHYFIVPSHKADGDFPRLITLRTLSAGLHFSGRIEAWFE